MAAHASRETVVSELNWLSAGAAAAAIRDRQLSPVELLQALLQRIDRIEPRLNAFIRLDAEGALAAAREAEREIGTGRVRGPLHGIPVGIKDIIDVAGHPTTCHSKILLDNVAAQDAFVVTRLRNAGAIILGKLATHEFATGGPCFDLPFPPARNPWNRDHHPGGSSSGAGAGVAAGLFPLALGTDTGGSVRNPASCCGIVGLKATYGMVSRRGVFPLAFSLDHVGPLARTIADCAVLLDAIAGHDPGDPGSRAAPEGSSASEIGKGLRGLRIGYVRHFHERDMPADPEMAAALDEAARTLSAEGAVLREVRLPDLNIFAAVNRVLLQSEAWAVHAKWLRERPGDYAQLTRRRLVPGAFLGAGDYVDAMRRRQHLIASVEDAFAEVDVLLTASGMDIPCRIDDPEAIARTYPRQARTPFNVTGHPALAMMAGRAKNGLPLALQFAARYWDERTLFRAAAGYERATRWHELHPNLEGTP
jgi:aspartyl-tRNA(Asn)/glutamyl-tRNA(Gln) amidotransferase subunit A